MGEGGADSVKSRKYNLMVVPWYVQVREGLKIEIHEIHQNLRNPVSLIGLQFLQLA